MSSQDLLIFWICLVCALTDLATGKIYNKVTYLGILLGFALNINANLAGLAACFLGLFVALLLSLPLYWVRALAAGDVKLLMAIGVGKGSAFLLSSSLLILGYACLFGVFALAYQGRLFPLLKWMGGSITALIVPGGSRPASTVGVTSMPFAPAIFCGTATALWMEHHSVWFNL